MKKKVMLSFAVVVLVLAVGGILFPFGLQPGKNIVYCALDCGVGYLYLSRPDQSWVPRPGFARGDDYILTFVMQGRILVVEKFHAGIPPLN